MVYDVHVDIIFDALKNGKNEKDRICFNFTVDNGDDNEDKLSSKVEQKMKQRFSDLEDAQIKISCKPKPIQEG